MKAILRFQNLMIALAFITIPLLGVTGCSDDDNGTNPNNDQGSARMYMTDAPTEDYDAVNIVITEVSVHMSGADSVSGWTVINSTSRTVNLLNLTNGNTDIIGESALDVGHYTQIRLKIGTGSNVVVEGTTYDLDIPSGSQTGLKLNHEFDIQANVRYDLILDFDASRSIHPIGVNRYQMRPVIRVLALAASGSISGVVSPASADAHIMTMAGSDSVGTYANRTSGGFKLMALPAGTYTVMIHSGMATYADSTITGVHVTAGQNTSIGTIALRSL